MHFGALEYAFTDSVTTLISGIDRNILFWSGRFNGSSKDGDARRKLGLPTESSWKVFAWMWSQNFAGPSGRVPPEGHKLAFVHSLLHSIPTHVFTIRLTSI